MKISGSCLCGSVRYEVDEPIAEPKFCHCSRCRKAHGAAFATFSWVNAEQFRWLAGADLMSRFESSPQSWRCFCRACGSQLVWMEGDRMGRLPVNCDVPPCSGPRR